MSDRRHTQRPALPEGYQFGDAHVLEVGDVSRCADGMWECFDGVEWFRTLRPEFWLIAWVSMYRPAMGCRIADDPWRAPHENAAAQLKRRQADASRCPQCGQPANLMASRQTVVTDAQTGRTSAVIERNNYCPSPFHFDAAQRTGDETI